MLGKIEYLTDKRFQISDIKKIDVIGKRWFDSDNGNTYHSVEVHINDKQIGYIPFDYGYGDAYKDTALTILRAVGLFTIDGTFLNHYPISSHKWLMYQRNDWVNFYCSDVKTRNEL